MLTQKGITEDTAREIAEQVGLEEIENQIKWLPYRTIKTNEAGFLISACLKKYPAPVQLKPKPVASGEGNEKWHRSDDAERASELRVFHQRRDALLRPWQQQPNEARKRWQKQAYERATDPVIRQSISLDGLSEHEPHKLILDDMALELDLQPISNGLTALVA